MSLAHFNAYLKYKKNQTGTYMKMVLGPGACKYLCKKARINDTAGAEKKRRLAQVKYDKWVVQQNHETDVKRKKCCEASSAKLAAVVPHVMPDEIMKMHVIEVDLQIWWHRQFDAEVPAAKHLKGKWVGKEGYFDSCHS
ncbi:hypothetical protein BD769DRAFT_1672324 [Suillus cothurnatus]|jgi:hypothetical protein|nr:hypothetical protein BD769DRAFT_1672324 [Suillus cothurnatus]